MERITINFNGSTLDCEFNNHDGQIELTGCSSTDMMFMLDNDYKGSLIPMIEQQIAEEYEPQQNEE